MKPILWLLMIPALLISVEAFSPRPAPHTHPTERYIPIGQSPGISGIYSFIGYVKSFNPTTGALIVVDEDSMESRSLLVADSLIFLDRSKVGKTNLVGSPNDIDFGRYVEVYPTLPEPGKIPAIIWIKIEILR